jgi:hypothetical protein
MKSMREENPDRRSERFEMRRMDGFPFRRTPFEGLEMKKVIFAVLLTALALFLFLPNLSWAF